MNIVAILMVLGLFAFIILQTIGIISDYRKKKSAKNNEIIDKEVDDE